jgi:hypothetical protein
VNLRLTLLVALFTRQDEPFRGGSAELPFAAVSPKTVVSGSRGAFGREEKPSCLLSRGQGSYLPSALCNRARSASTTSDQLSPALRPEVALVAWRWWVEPPRLKEAPTGFPRDQGLSRLWADPAPRLHDRS